MISRGAIAEGQAVLEGNPQPFKLRVTKDKIAIKGQKHSIVRGYHLRRKWLVYTKMQLPVRGRG